MKLIKELPDLFLMNDGQRVATVEDWNRHRVEIKAMMLNSQYGTMPAAPGSVTVTASAPETLDAGETREQLHFEFLPKKARPDITFGMDVTVWRPSPEAVKWRKQSVKGFGQNGIPLLIYIGDTVFDNLLKNGYMMVCYENRLLESMEMGVPIAGPVRKAYEKLEPGKYSWGSISVWAKRNNEG